MNKYGGIKLVQVAGEDDSSSDETVYHENASLSFVTGKKRSLRLPKILLLQLLVCCLFVAAFILLRYIDNPVLQNILDIIYRAITFDMIGTDPSECLVNGWLSGLA